MKIIHSLFFAVAVLLLAGCQTPGARSNRVEWEYKRMTVTDFMSQNQLDELGKDGWILCGFDYDQNSVRKREYVFGRPRQ